MTTLRLPCHAKVNLGLEVLGLRQDGYHELRTIFQTIDLHDDLVLRRTSGPLTLRCDHPEVPTDGSNLVLRAAEELRRYARVRAGAAITLAKRIPVAGGLGGGSSDAAMALLGLDRLWRVGLGPSGLQPLARRIGADVPFFLMGGTALGLGRGDEVFPLRRQLRAPVVVVDAARPLSTAAVFRRLDASLTPRENSHTIFRFVSRDLEGLGDALGVLSNDLEQAALEEAPDLAGRVRRIRGILVREGAVLASLSGSGASYFGVFDDPGRARRAQAALAAQGFRALRARTLSLDQYRRRLARSVGTTSSARGSNQGRSGHHGDHGRQGHPGGRREAQGVRLDRV
jgi:4-diphosphocytidyl-2-C-methyl-D-erythritol kinase